MEQKMDIPTLVERLREWNGYNDELMTEAAERIEALERALEPFAKLGEMANFAFAPALFADSDTVHSLPWKDDGMEVTITFGDLRCARAALKEPTT